MFCMYSKTNFIFSKSQIIVATLLASTRIEAIVGRKIKS